MNTYQLKLDLNKGPTHHLMSQFGGVTIRQGDKNGTTISADLYDHGTALDTSGLSAYFVMPLPDREHYYRKAASLANGTVSVVVDETEAASVAGKTDNAYFELLQGSTVIASTQSFPVTILRDALAGKEPGETYDTEIQEAIDNLNEAVEGIPDVVETVLEDHPEWTTTVEDGSITEPKLHSSLMGRLTANVPTGNLAEGSVLKADDAAATPIRGANVYGKTEDGSSIEALSLVVAPEGFNLMLGGDASKTANVGSSGNAYTSTYHTAAWLDQFRSELVAEQTVMTISFDWTFEGTPDANTYIFGQFRNAAPANNLIIATCGTNPTYPVRQYITESSGRYWVTFRVSSGQITTTNQSNRARVYAPNGSVLTIHNYKLEFGTLTDWTPAPEEAGQAVAIDLDGHVLASDGDTRDELQVSRDGSVKLIQRVGAQATYDLPAITMPMQGNPITYAWVQSSPTTTLAVEYERDIDLALAAARDEALAAIADPDGPVASSNHAVGTYLTMGGKLYRVTTAIAAGETVTPGTNVTATTVMAEVVSLIQ